MTQAAIKEKVLNLQAQVEMIRKALIRKPDFAIDETNWAKVRPTAKRIRKTLYRKRYGKR